MEPLKQNLDSTISLGDHSEKQKISFQPSPAPCPRLVAASSPVYVRSAVKKEQKQCEREESTTGYITRRNRILELQQMRIRDRDRAAPYFRERRLGQPERFYWNFERHKRLVDAVDLLGGIEKATWENVFAIMKPREESIRPVDVAKHLRRLRMMFGVERWFESTLQLPCLLSRSSPGVSESGTFSSLLDGLKEMKLEPKGN